MANRDDLEVELTVTVNFGKEHEPVVLIHERKLPLVKTLLYLRRNAAVVLYMGILRAAALRPLVMKQIVPVAAFVPKKAWQFAARRGNG